MTGQVHDAKAPLGALNGRLSVRGCSRCPAGPAVAGARAEIAAPVAGAKRWRVR
ncbi:hypothetical protein [Kutzneria sp. NPDC052558]|uniref:hypothetical protein n=1 Tax=Kutzneria sp. NPDC052558 TaxID=3364121 RepID=UPI0037C56F58